MKTQSERISQFRDKSNRDYERWRAKQYPTGKAEYQVRFSRGLLVIIGLALISLIGIAIFG